jgi:MinD-like ATPase involved in chromosome partitioning or flagellar assembly
MIIAFTSPRKGAGQTVLASLAALRLNLSQDKKVNLVDLNLIRDIEHYFSDTALVRSLDDFSLLATTRILSDESFIRKCTKEVIEGLSITSSPEQYVITKDIVAEFVQYAEKFFDHLVIDCVSGTELNSTQFYDAADKIVVVINQSRRLVHHVAELKNYYQAYADKLVFVVNRYSETLPNYGVNEIKKELKEIGFDCPVLTLPETAKVVEDANSNNLKGFVVKTGPKVYTDALDTLIAKLLSEAE